jgi:aminoglycoside phosphotransferase (APT) family kinase protein
VTAHRSPPSPALRLPWQAEYALDVDTVRATLARELPDFVVDSVRPLGEGFDFTTFVVGEEWVFRFAKRRQTARTLAREIALLDALAAELERAPGTEGASLAIPAYRYRCAPALSHPPAFGAYRMLPGEPLLGVPAAALDRRAIGATLGGWLRTVHAAAPLPPPPARTPDHFANCIDEYRSLCTHCRAHLPVVIADALAALLAEPPPPFTGPTRFCHADLGVEHVLVDRTNGRVTAVIDWGDAGWDDPLGDFVGLWAWGGDAAVEAALAHYGRTLGADEWRRLRLRGACYGLGMIHYGVFDQRPLEARFGRAILSRMHAAGQLEDTGRPDAATPA